MQGYRNNTDANQVSPLLVEKYLDAAEVLAAEAVTSRLETLAPCSAGSDTAACGHEFIRSFGLRAFRRPLEAEELAVFERLFDEPGDRKAFPGADRRKWRVTPPSILNPICRIVLPR